MFASRLRQRVQMSLDQQPLYPLFPLTLFGPQTILLLLASSPSLSAYAINEVIMSRIRIQIAALLLAILSPTFLEAQTVTGTITGSVVDGTGAAVPAATVLLRNDRTGDARTQNV